MIDCVSHNDYELHTPEHLREENGSEYLFMCEDPFRLISPVKVSGRHKIWDLERPVPRAAALGLEAPPYSILKLTGDSADDSSPPFHGAMGGGGTRPTSTGGPGVAAKDAFELEAIKEIIDYREDSGMSAVIQTLSLEKAFRPQASKRLNLLPEP